MMRPGVSIILPCYNESKRINETVKQANEHLLFNPRDEIIFVSDGSTDRTVKQINAKKRNDKIKVISYGENKGKWYALKIGYFNAKKRFVLFLDADLSVDFDILQDLWEEKLFKDNVLVIGNRYLGEVLIPVSRLIASRIFNKLARKITGIEVADSQCPGKLLPKTKKMDDIMWFMSEKGFCGDVELLVRAKKAGIKIREFYAIYDFQEGSSVNIWKHGFQMLKALFRIRKYI